jgi:hypothetical protein
MNKVFSESTRSLFEPRLIEVELLNYNVKFFEKSLACNGFPSSFSFLLDSRKRILREFSSWQITIEKNTEKREISI